MWLLNYHLWKLHISQPWDFTFMYINYTWPTVSCSYLFLYSYCHLSWYKPQQHFNNLKNYESLNSRCHHNDKWNPQLQQLQALYKKPESKSVTYYKKLRYLCNCILSMCILSSKTCEFNWTFILLFKWLWYLINIAQLKPIVMMENGKTNLPFSIERLAVHAHTALNNCKHTAIYCSCNTGTCRVVQHCTTSLKSSLKWLKNDK